MKDYEFDPDKFREGFDPDKFREEAHQMDEYDRRVEWPLLHGDAMTPTGRLSVHEPQFQKPPERDRSSRSTAKAQTFPVPPYGTR